MCIAFNQLQVSKLLVVNLLSFIFLRKVYNLVEILISNQLCLFQLLLISDAVLNDLIRRVLDEVSEHISNDSAHFYKF